MHGGENFIFLDVETEMMGVAGFWFPFSYLRTHRLLLHRLGDEYTLVSLAKLGACA